MTRVGIVGAGAIARLHSAQWKKLPVTLAAVYDRNPERAAAFAAEHGGADCGSLDELLAQVDVVDICTHTDGHRAAVLAAAAARVPILCEKPFGRRLQECEEMIEACEATGTPLFVAHVVRFFPQYARAKELIDSGAIGKPGVIRTMRAGSYPRSGSEFSSAFYRDFTRSGGVILDLGIHDIDFQCWCAGEVERVFARGLTFQGIPETDHALLTLRFSSGALGHIDCSWALPPGQFRTHLEIAGDAGLLEWDSFQPPPLIWTKPNPLDPSQSIERGANPLAPHDDPYYRQLAHFLECLEQGKPFLVTPQEAYRAVKVALACIESVRSGQPVELAGFREEVA
ncbi:MAG TPA: Gfo/Idh/MocA family oxidoreductase [Caldilineaceae bacterium]|nr:Gfo/Idh/MocA family oxidoreductase [Caldilineaceae bacterium]